MPEPNNGVENQLIVCTGKIKLGDGKQGIAFRLVEGHHDGPERFTAGKRELLYSVKNLKKCRAGSIYTANFAALNAEVASIQPDSVQWKGTWPNEAERMKWQEAEQAMLVSERARKQEKTEGGLKQALETLQPLRELHKTTDYIGKLALEVQVLAYLRSGKVVGHGTD